MTKWVVTGYSTKFDSFCYIVQAKSGIAALKKVAELRGNKLKLMDSPLPDVMYNDQDGYEPTYEEISEEPRWHWNVMVGKVRENVNLSEVVGW